MNPKYKASWLTALRSGQFEQGRGALQNGSKYCCLGVLCRIAGVPRTVATESTVYAAGAVLFGGMATLPPTWCQAEFGLTFDEIDHLTILNDMDKLNFNQIADYIEANL
jgi:hypothetical protein